MKANDIAVESAKGKTFRNDAVLIKNMLAPHMKDKTLLERPGGIEY